MLNKDQIDLLFQACECCMPCVKDGWIDGMPGPTEWSIPDILTVNDGGVRHRISEGEMILKKHRIFAQFVFQMELLSLFLYQMAGPNSTKFSNQIFSLMLELQISIIFAYPRF